MDRPKDRGHPRNKSQFAHFPGGFTIPHGRSPLRHENTRHVELVHTMNCAYRTVYDHPVRLVILEAPSVLIFFNRHYISRIFGKLERSGPYDDLA